MKVKSNRNFAAPHSCVDHVYSLRAVPCNDSAWYRPASAKAAAAPHSAEADFAKARGNAAVPLGGTAALTFGIYARNLSSRLTHQNAPGPTIRV